jgi:hypothetical protein
MGYQFASETEVYGANKAEPVIGRLTWCRVFKNPPNLYAMSRDVNKMEASPAAMF